MPGRVQAHARVPAQTIPRSSREFPQGARHVFCFAYYVTPPPTSGTIVIRKEDDAPPDTAAHDFTFEGQPPTRAT